MGHRLLLLACLALAAALLLGHRPADPWPGGQSGGGSNANSGPLDSREKAMLIVGDSWVNGRERDEPVFHALQQGEFHLYGGGLLSRLNRALGGSEHSAGGFSAGAVDNQLAAGSLYHGAVQTTGLMFGPGAQFDVVRFVRDRPQIRDVLLLTGAADYFGAAFGTPCAHGSPFDPTTAASGNCTVAQSLTNLSYVIDQLVALGVSVHWQLHPAYYGLWQDDFLGTGATTQTAIETLYDDMVVYCFGKPCFAGKGLYRLVCQGDATAPDPTAASDCQAVSRNYGDGLGHVPRQNQQLIFYEDALTQARLGGFFHVHPSGYGYGLAFRRLMEDMDALDSTLGHRYAAFAATDWVRTPAIPTVTLGAITSAAYPNSTIAITSVRRGTFVNGTSGTLGSCYLGACEYLCWATCVETVVDSADPSCFDGVDPITVAREYGAQGGASHINEGVAVGDIETLSPRQVLRLQEGQGGVLYGLAPTTEYDVVCIAASPTAMSFPAVRPAPIP